MNFFLKPLVGIALNGFSLYVVTQTVDGVIYTGGIKLFIIGGIIIGLINFFVKPLIKIVSLPLIAVTGGIFLVVINVFLLWFFSYFLDVAQFQDVAINFQNLQSYVIGAIVFGFINWTLHLIS